jgi:Kef-type K+ transport system membrane component KefB
VTVDERGHVASRRRMAIGYVSLLTVVGIVIAVSLSLGSERRPAPAFGGVYRAEEGTACLGERFEVVQSGVYVTVEGEGRSHGRLRFVDRRIEGEVTCADGTTAPISLAVEGRGTDARLGGTVAGEAVTASVEPAEEEGVAEAERRSAEETFGRLMLAIAAVILAARLVGALVARIGQPRVMGEVLAGILLGPTLLGTVAPSVTGYLFPPDIIPLLAAGADIGLVFYMFLVGLELDPDMLKGRVEQAAFISHGSIAIPMALGIAVAVPIFPLIAPDSPFLPFALFLGVSMSITAFPVLARILVERRMLRHPVGAMAIGAAAVDDVTAWALLALASGVAVTGGITLDLGRIVLLAAAFSLFMAFVGRRLLARVAVAYDEAGHVPAGWIAAIFVGVLLSAYVAASIPIAAIFGAFVMGLILPRRGDLAHDVNRRLEDFVTTVLLPLFFVVTGLKTQVGLLDRPALWLMTLALIVVAIFCKFVGATAAARFTGMGWRESAVIGTLMNTRGLTELIVLNIALELGMITPALFTMLVIMALVTSFMAGPLLRLFDPHRRFSAPPEEELRRAEEPAHPGARPPERAILVAVQDERNLDALMALVAPMASSEPRREVILARLVVPPRTATGGLVAASRQLTEASRELAARREALAAGGVAARSVAFTSADPGEDLVRLSAEHEVDLILLDGRRPLLGGGVPRGEVGAVLEHAECDVAVLVDRGHAPPQLGPGRPVLVPFGGAEHDWAALELGAWIASAADTPLRLLGAEAGEGDRDASRLLGNASLVVQQFAGIPAEPVLIAPGREGVVAASEGAGLLVVGLSERWRQEGLGPVRAEIASAAQAPVVFVRRGLRPGALAGREDVTRFTWSSVGPARRG